MSSELKFISNPATGDQLGSFTDGFTLANGVKIPCIGYGTWQTPSDGTTRNCVMRWKWVKASVLPVSSGRIFS